MLKSNRSSTSRSCHISAKQAMIVPISRTFVVRYKNSAICKVLSTGLGSKVERTIFHVLGVSEGTSCLYISQEGTEVSVGKKNCHKHSPPMAGLELRSSSRRLCCANLGPVASSPLPPTALCLVLSHFLPLSSVSRFPASFSPTRSATSVGHLKARGLTPASSPF